jgi:hypothetical protein
MGNSTHNKLDKILALLKQILALLQTPTDFSKEDAVVLAATAKTKASDDQVKTAISNLPPQKQ